MPQKEDFDLYVVFGWIRAAHRVVKLMVMLH
jgi:hypothetical protein